MYNKLIKFLDKYNILDQNQFGFRQGHSTHHAFITLVDKITKSLDNGDIVIGMFIDLKKAFDTVDHKILLKKLYYYGICRNALKWFESYLTNRSQYVLFNGEKLRYSGYNIWCITRGSKRHNLQAVELLQPTQAAVQIVSNLPAPSNGGPINCFFLACRLYGSAGWLALLLTEADDVETNPGPTTLNKKV